MIQLNLLTLVLPLTFNEHSLLSIHFMEDGLAADVQNVMPVLMKISNDTMKALMARKK